MFLNIFTPYHDYYNAITANCNDFLKRLEALEVLEALEYFSKIFANQKKTICYKKLIQNIQYIQNIQKVSHENLSITFMQCSQLRLPCR